MRDLHGVQKKFSDGCWAWAGCASLLEVKVGSRALPRPKHTGLGMTTCAHEGYKVCAHEGYGVSAQHQLGIRLTLVYSHWGALGVHACIVQTPNTLYSAHALGFHMPMQEACSWCVIARARVSWVFFEDFFWINFGEFFRFILFVSIRFYYQFKNFEVID